MSPVETTQHPRFSMKPVVKTVGGTRRIQIVKTRTPKASSLNQVSQAQTEKGIRSAAVRAYQDGHSVTAIARAAGRPRSTVYTWLPTED